MQTHIGIAPEVGFEPTTNRLIPTMSGLYHWFAFAEQALANESGGFPRFDFAFTAHGTRAIRMFFRPNQNPRTIFARKFACGFVGAVVILHAFCKIVGMTGVE